ncbi:growth arrest-specific protein 6-like [Trichomycterus rosablanca]|uniref:growth arrest-specific protein 6-like n=1 Tax=Trichomycterus rosablanca TaxID=2290929 RepID=UPI002F3501D5
MPFTAGEFLSGSLLILLLVACSSELSLSPEEAHQFLRRHRRANQVFEETKKGHLERECVEERCSKEEAREVFENDPETAQPPNMAAGWSRLGVCGHLFIWPTKQGVRTR